MQAVAFGAQELHAQSACLSRCFLVIGVRENMLELGSVYNWRVRTVACARGGDKVARKRDEQKRVVCVRESKCFHLSLLVSKFSMRTGIELLVWKCVRVAKCLHC